MKTAFSLLILLGFAHSAFAQEKKQEEKQEMKEEKKERKEFTPHFLPTNHALMYGTIYLPAADLKKMIDAKIFTESAKKLEDEKIFTPNNYSFAKIELDGNPIGFKFTFFIERKKFTPKKAALIKKALPKNALDGFSKENKELILSVLQFLEDSSEAPVKIKGVLTITALLPGPDEPDRDAEIQFYFKVKF